MTLGLDIGPDSIGWAIVTSNNGQPSGLLDAGVRVFPEGVDRDTQGHEKPKNAQRREARLRRRQLARRRARRIKLLGTLRRAGLLPDKDETLREVFAADPYELRARALDARLEPFELGRVLFHINQRRGFKSNRKTDRIREDGKVLAATKELAAKIEQSGCRTLGEYLHRIGRKGRERIRGRYTLRAMYEHEFEQIWSKQREFHPDLLTDELRCRLRDQIIFYQRPLKPMDDRIGRCECEPDEPRCPRADWHAQQFRLLKEVNNLRIQNPDGTERDLREEERDKLIQTLMTRKEMTFDRIRRLLGLLDSQMFNLEQTPTRRRGPGQAGRSKLQGNSIEAALIDAFGKKAWKAISEPQRAEIRQKVCEVEDPDELRRLTEEWGLKDDKADKLVHMDLPDGYMAYSLKAIQKMLPYLEQGCTEYEARDRCGYNQPRELPACDRLPPPETDDRQPLVRNPLVRRALHEVRKVVNAILREYGRPDKIVVEMVRDMKHPAWKREEIQRRIRQNQQERDQARQRLVEEFGLSSPTGRDILALRLWEQQRHQCIYTGRAISKDDLSAFFHGQGVLDIDHILPYGRSLDNSQNNKVLCFASANREKGDRTPREWLGEGTPEYEQMLQRVAACAESGMPYAKRRKFSQQNVELDEFVNRQLNDTSYIAREVRKYLQCLYEGDQVERARHVVCTRGQVTAALRHEWGLNTILSPDGSDEKNRADHRHHAIDAIVVALTTPSHLQQLARTKGPSRLALREPWPRFRADVEAKIRDINVSHRVARRVAGALHEETNYGPTAEPSVFVYRKRLEELTPAMVPNIRDAAIRKIVIERLKKHGFDPDAGGSKPYPAEVWREPLTMPSGVPIKKVRITTTLSPQSVILLKDRNTGRTYRAAKLGSNHHVEIFEYTDDKGHTRREGVVVSMFEAAQRIRRGEPIVKRDHGPGKRFVMSLAKNEMVMLKLDDESYQLHRVQKISPGLIALRPHYYAGKVSDYDKPPLIQRRTPSTLEGYKVTIDPLGRIHPAND